MAGTRGTPAHQQRRIGLILVAIGVLAPLLLLLITTGYSKDLNTLTNILTVRIIVWGPSEQQPSRSALSDFATATGQPSNHSPGIQREIGIPYRFPLAFCILLIFFGIRQIDQSRTRNGNENQSYKSG